MTKNRSSDSPSNSAAPAAKVSPSQFMRWLRPEYYSDTEDQASYVLEASVFGHHLETLTQRNQTHDFEIFCRKLCERTICPNLRPQTGPEGGGDGKVDSETYPVSEEVAVLRYVGEVNGGKEKWAFAFSTNKEWAKKVRADVKGIVETGRKYDKMFCVTSRAAKSKDRLNLEKELTEQCGIPVIIHDRSWIVKEVIEDDRKDLAFNYLKAGEVKNNPLNLGPKDYSRARQIAEIEKEIENPAAFEGMEGQRVTEALIVAKLSRNLERPRTETDGRFLRAIRLADADGTDRQKLEARYEHLWTAFWWFDDFKLVNDSYEAFETLALQSDHVKNLEFLCNLLQALFNSVIHNHMSREECHLDKRIANLKQVLEPMAKDESRPNNSLEAHTSLLIIRMSEAVLDKKREGLSDIWREFSSVLEKASGLGEFNAERMVGMVEIAGDIAGNDPAYNELVDKTAKFVASRKSEAEGALILLKRAQKLDFSDNFEMIRLLGKATIGLTKKEYTEQLIEAVQLLTCAYRSAGLLWAARASCVFLAASLVMEGEEESQLPPSFIPTMKMWAWIALELRNLPDYLFAIQLLNGALAGLPLTDDTKEIVIKDIRELELALGCQFLNLDESELPKLENVPDALEPFGLFMARAALLYNLGYLDAIRADGSVPAVESDEDVNKMFSILASQPVAKELQGSINLNSETQQALATAILGMTVEISFDGSVQSILIAETMLGSLEAFFATAIEQRIIPHTEKLRINLSISDKVSKPTFEINTSNMTGTMIWPAAVSLTTYGQQGDIQQFLMEASARILTTACVLGDAETVIQKLCIDEVVQHRMVMIALAANSYHRVASRSITRMSDWQRTGQKSYPLRIPRPTLSHFDLEAEEPTSAGDEGRISKLPEIKDHRVLSVRSVIDIHAWDQAKWRGTAYAQFDTSQPPYMAFMFENEEAARNIFERWRERFGECDEDEEIYLSIIRQLPQQNRHHYCVSITSKIPAISDRKQGQVLIMASRSKVMEPNSDVNLERFLESYRRAGKFYLVPAVLNSTGVPELLFELAILKHSLNVKLAANVGEHDPEAMALRAGRNR
jgi:hypothetical protein